MHPNDKAMNHRPTDTAIKNNVMLALGTSRFSPYSILHQRYRQTDHANKTWADLRLDIELIITNNSTGTALLATLSFELANAPAGIIPQPKTAPPGLYTTHTTMHHLLSSTTTASAPKTPNTTIHRTSAPLHRPQRHPLQQPRMHTPAPTAALTTVQLNARTPSATSARLPFPVLPLVRHITLQTTSTNPNGHDSDPRHLVTTTPHPHHHSSPAPQRT
jgi:hypothetical protein